MDPARWIAFAMASLVVLVTPGPAVAYIVARSVHQGFRAGFVSTLGLSAGGLVHVAAAATGVAALFASTPAAYTLVLAAGGAYLLLLGVRTLVSGGESAGDPAIEESSAWAIFRDGLVVNLLNPKAVLFILAFLPQFTDPARGAIGLQLLALGVAFTGLGVATDLGYAYVAGRLHAGLARREGARRAARRVAGTTYLVLGAASLARSLLGA